jgi:hypothetical protein
LKARNLFLGACALGLSALVWQWVREKPPPYPLQTTVSSALLEVADARPASAWSDSVTWRTASELWIERRFSVPWSTYSSCQQLRIRFSPPDAPQVAVFEWRENSADADWLWFIGDVTGEAWISSDGQDLGTSAGPDLALKWTFDGVDSTGSLEHSEGTLLLKSEQLTRN